jgi:hypothetical protein
MELVNTIEEHEIAVTIYYSYQFTPSNTHNTPHTLSPTSWIRTSNKEWGNNMHLLILQEHDEDFLSHRSSNKVRIHHVGFI